MSIRAESHAPYIVHAAATRFDESPKKLSRLSTEAEHCVVRPAADIEVASRVENQVVRPAQPAASGLDENIFELTTASVVAEDLCILQADYVDITVGPE